MKTEREKQVARALAAERAQRVDSEAYLHALRRNLRWWIPIAAVLNVVLMVVMIAHGVYAFAGNLVVLPILWLAWWLNRLALARDAAPPPSPAARAWHAVAPDTHPDPDDDPSSHVAPRDCIFTDTDECVICGTKHPFAASNATKCNCPQLLKTTLGTFRCPVHGQVQGEAVPADAIQARWPHPLDNP